MHKASGQGIVTLFDGVRYKDIYCGAYGTKPCERKYNATIAAWLTNDKKLPADLVASKAKPEVSHEGVTIVELADAYLTDRRAYFTGDGEKPARSFERVKSAAKLLDEHFGDQPAETFGPVKLRALREKLIADPNKSRNYINEMTGQVRAVFKWGASHELVGISVYQSLCTLEPLRSGRTKARDGAPVKPIDDKTVDATILHLSPTVAAMVNLQLLTGMRPGEVVLIRPCDIDRSNKVWTFRPARHKTMHLGKSRVVMIGPRAQKILKPFLERKPDTFCFSPAEAQAARVAELSKLRKTPLCCGNKPGTNRKSKPAMKPGECYTAVSYARAIARGCERAFPAPEGLEPAAVKAWNKKHCWQPNRLRHSTATLIREKFGIEAASVVLGHAKVSTTELYAEKNLAAAMKISATVG